jgi:SPP1 family predicted phage head-tail adaptor
MKAGPLDRRVTIQRKTVVYDEYNEAIEAWAELATLSAQVVQQSGREFLSNDQTQAERRVLFRLRWFKGVTVLDRVTYGGRVHNIQDVKELGRREGLELLTLAAA